MYDEEEKKEMLSALRTVKKASGTDIAKKALKSKERSSSMVCKVAHKMFYEAIEAYEDGSMEWSEMVEDLYKTLKAIEPEDFE